VEDDVKTMFHHPGSRDKDTTAETLKSPITLVGPSDAGAHLIYHAGYGYATRFFGC